MVNERDRRERTRKEDGFALLVALVVLLLVSIALALVAAALQIRMRLVRQEAQTVRLMALSDAALAETLASLTYNPDFDGVAEQAFGGGRIASAVRPLGSSRYEVLAVALYAGKERAVDAEVVRTPLGARVVRWERAHR
jgi:type II secretory pathway pseudopilin PulG